jgi:hypothetical protein
MKILRKRTGCGSGRAIDDACPDEKRGWRGSADGGWGGRGREGGEKAVLRKVRNIHPDCSCVFELGCHGAAPTHRSEGSRYPCRPGNQAAGTWRCVAGAALIGPSDVGTMHVPAAEGRLDRPCAKQAHHPVTWRALLDDRQHNRHTFVLAASACAGDLQQHELPRAPRSKAVLSSLCDTRPGARTFA